MDENAGGVVGGSENTATVQGADASIGNTQVQQNELPQQGAENGDLLTSENTQEQVKQNPQEPQDPMDAVPEFYELTSKTGQLAEDANEFQDIFKKAGLTRRQAQAMYEAYNLKGNDIAEQFKQAIAQKVESDMKAVQQDQELGGTNLKNTKMYIGKAMDKFGSPELRAKLQQAGFGNDPDFVRFVARVGKAFSNDEFIGGHGTNGRAEDSISKAKRMYPKSPELWR